MSSQAGTAATRLTRFAWLSIAAALTTMALKMSAAAATGSVGLLSDAMESGVNLVAACIALIALRAAESSPDDEFVYGRAKAEYLSAGIEGTLILLAAGSIAVVAVARLINPTEVSSLGIGVAVSSAAAIINGVVAMQLLRAGRAHRSITLEADGKHLLTDVWTSAGVLLGIALVGLTKWHWLDPIVAIGVAVNIVVSGFVLIRRSVRGLLDVSLPPEQLRLLEEIMERHRTHSVDFHALRTRQAGRRSFATLHVLVPGTDSVAKAHNLAERVEAEMRAAIPMLTVTLHIEPLEDPRSFADESLDRRTVPPSASEQIGRTTPYR